MAFQSASARSKTLTLSLFHSGPDSPAVDTIPVLHQQPFTNLNWSHAAVEQGLQSFLEAIIFFFPGQQTISGDLWAAITALALSKQLGLGTRARPADTACRMIFILGEAWGTRTWELPFPPRWASTPSCYLHHGTLQQGSPRWE